MKTQTLLAIAACGGIILAPFASDTNRVSIPTPSARLDAPEASLMPGPTNLPPALQSTPETIYANTNAVLRLPYVQTALLQAFQQGVQFGVGASIQNKTLVEMQDAQALIRVANYMRFGAQPQEKR